MNSMAIRNIEGKWYVDFRFRHTRYRRKSPVNAKGAARAYETLLLQKLTAGEAAFPSEADSVQRKPQFEEFSWQWFETYVRTNNKPSEQRSKATHLQLHLIPVFGHRRLHEVSSQLVEQFKAQQLRKGLCAKTVNNHLATLRKCLNCAVEWELLDHTPRFQLLRAPRRLPTTLSDEECGRLLNDYAEPMWHTMILLALRSGLRLGEIIGLTWIDLNLKEGVLVVRQSIVRGIVSTPKSGNVRVLPMDQEMVNALARLPKHKGSDVVFPRENGEPLSQRICEHGLARACRRAGVRHIGWHVLRHTFATQLLQEREPIRNIQQLLGHSTLAMTERYTHVLMPHLRSSIQVLARRQARLLEHFGHYVGTGPISHRGTRDSQDPSHSAFLSQ